MNILIYIFRNKEISQGEKNQVSFLVYGQDSRKNMIARSAK